MKKIILASTLILSTLGGTGFAHASEANDLEKLVKLQPGVTKSEVQETVTDLSKETGLSEEEIIATGIKELTKQSTLDKREETLTARGGSSGEYKLKPARNKGDLFYTSSKTWGTNHGHSGIYYTKEKIVESVQKEGVRKIDYRKRNVERNAVMQSVSTTQAKRNAAANWANSRVGDKYSYNFATNKKTSHTGAKNCSKLIWSAYKLKASIDLDGDGGFGVYPRDIRDSKLVKTYKTIN